MVGDAMLGRVPGHNGRVKEAIANAATAAANRYPELSLSPEEFLGSGQAALTHRQRT